MLRLRFVVSSSKVFSSHLEGRKLYISFESSGESRRPNSPSSSSSSNIIKLRRRGETEQESDNLKISRKVVKTNKKSFVWSYGSCICLVLPFTAFCLGCWQVYRLRWKLDLIDRIKLRKRSKAVPFPYENFESLKDMEYQTVQVTGQFLHDREFAILPRGRFDPGYPEQSAGLIARSNISSHGAHIITPFRLTSGATILINRGWVPPEKVSSKRRLIGQVDGLVTFDAVVRLSEKRPQFVMENRPNDSIWFYKDLDMMGRHYFTEPILLDAVYESTISGGPIGGQTNMSIRNEHLSYVITWYSLAAITFAMWIKKFRR